MASDHDIRELISTGKKIEAIKLYRERYGVGLKEAKDAVDAAAAGRPLTSPPPRAPSEAPSEPMWGPIDECLRRGSKIEAIKLYRERTGVGLKDAKDAVEARQAADPTLQTKQGCFIATAAYGSAWTPEVVALRAFRDGALLPRPAGRRFVRLYYQLSPPVARCVRRSAGLRWCIRQALRPLVAAVNWRDWWK